MELLYGHYNYWVVAFLVLVGFYGMLVKRNLMRKIMAMNILQVGVIFFFISLSAKSGAFPPILNPDGGVVDISKYVNPLPHALMLTAIVVSVSTTGVALALLLRFYHKYRSFNERDLLRKINE